MKCNSSKNIRKNFINYLFCFVLFCEFLFFTAATAVVTGVGVKSLRIEIMNGIGMFGIVIQFIMLILYPIAKLTRKFNFSGWIVFCILFFFLYKGFVKK
jgi:hypothetical protein